VADDEAISDGKMRLLRPLRGLAMTNMTL